MSCYKNITVERADQNPDPTPDGEITHAAVIEEGDAVAVDAPSEDTSATAV